MSSVVSAWAPKSERARIVGFSFSGEQYKEDKRLISIRSTNDDAYVS